MKNKTYCSPRPDLLSNLEGKDDFLGWLLRMCEKQDPTIDLVPDLTMTVIGLCWIADWPIFAVILSSSLLKSLISLSHPPSAGIKISWRSMVYCSIIVCITALIILKKQTKHIAFTNQNNCTVFNITAHVRLIIILKKCDGMRRKQLIGWCLRVWGCPSDTSHHSNTHKKSHKKESNLLVDVYNHTHTNT